MPTSVSRAVFALALLSPLVLTAGCSEDALAPDCGSICYQVVSYGNVDCPIPTSEACEASCESAIGEDTAALSACDDCVRHTNDTCFATSCTQECGGFIGDAVEE